MNLWRIEFEIVGHGCTVIAAALTPGRAKVMTLELFQHQMLPGFKCKQIGVAATNIREEEILCWAWDGYSPTDWKSF